ncbi:hypothetical protein DFH05DRAFT_1471903 [Lentinula detonsa]|uniref:Uncharacterized protein n=1 Tax=Lentinula detonsa TaxID=2804962 RepID=A0A9W8U3Z3_9AGAR|nr:hypothetical protein DFH05DRAFT_1471903 [Lentinula detonsa]
MLFLLLLLPLVFAESTNTTFDDTSPEFTWETGWAASPCDYCSALLNQSLTYNGTWHDGGSHTGLTATFDFWGTAVYLYGVTSQNDTGTIEFMVDGVNGTTYVPMIVEPGDASIGTPEADHGYNTLFFSATGLQNGSHQLGLTAVLGYNTSQTVLIDYAVVTTDNSTTSSSSPSPSPSPSPSHSNTALIGGLVGGILGLILLSLALFIYIRRSTHPKHLIRPLYIPPTAYSNSTNPNPDPNSNPKSQYPLSSISNTSPTSTSSSSPINSGSTRSRRSTHITSTIIESTTTRNRQEIDEMDNRIRSLETMLRLNRADPSSTIISPLSEHPYLDDLSNPPPPY